MSRLHRFVVPLVALGLLVLALPASATYGKGVDVLVGVVEGTAIRDFNLYVAPRVPALAPVPLLIVLHGLNNYPNSAEYETGLDTLADTENIALAYPQSLDSGWNAGTCCGSAVQNQVDDVKFLTDMIAMIETIRPIDRTRVYIAGFSNGGMMALRAICDRPDVFAAAAAASGTLVAPCPTVRPISVLMINGLRDSTVPYNGSRYSTFLHTSLPSVPTSVAILANRSHCSSPTISVTARYRDRTYRCQNGSSIETIAAFDLGHHWATLADNGIDGGGITWSFLRSHALGR